MVVLKLVVRVIVMYSAMQMVAFASKDEPWWSMLATLNAGIYTNVHRMLEERERKKKDDDDRGYPG